MADRALYTQVISLLIYLQALKAQHTADCDFEDGFCDWSIGPSSDRNWTRSNVKSITPATGPSTGHTLDTTNYYIYLYARDFTTDNGFIQPGKCVLECPDFNTGLDGGCFRFWYHMHGGGIGNLSFVVKQGADSYVSFSKTGEQGTGWNCGSFSLDGNQTNVKIEITATPGANLIGDIALDDFKYYSQYCQQLPGICSDNTTSPTSTNTSDTISQNPTSPSAAAPPGTTSSTATATTTEAAPDDTWIIYVAIVPIAIFIVGGVIAFCVFKMRKKPKKYPIYDSTRSPRHEVESTGECEPEVYAELDETEMNEFNDNDGYMIPAENGVVLSNNNSNFPVNENGRQDFMRMKSKQREAPVKDDDASSVHSYVEALPAPVGNMNPPKSCGPNVKPGVSNSAFLTGESDGLRTGMSNRTVNTGKSNRGFEPGLDAGRLGGGRGSPAPDYDEGDAQRPPPSCGPTNAYISPVYEN